MSTAEAEKAYGDPDTRVTILDATWDLVESGERVTLARVAALAKVSRQAVYLHFGDRSRLLLALVQHVDESLGSASLKAHMWDARTGRETLHRWVEALSIHTPKIDALTQILERGQYDDPDLRAAWRDRMEGRREIIDTVIERIDHDGDLAATLTRQTAVDLVHAMTMPGVWRELTAEQGWSANDFATHVAALLCNGLTSQRPALDDASSSS